MGIFILAAVLVLGTAGGTPASVREAVESIPLIGRLLSGSVSPTAAKAPPEPADMELIERLIEEGFLSDHPCEWYSVL
ncbi:hypothetical protein GX411_07250 [Candidatus Fermentibacteria bacterium]|nr:hypothetical protein [Candidatus Fermentibacteria bacterium]